MCLLGRNETITEHVAWSVTARSVDPLASTRKASQYLEFIEKTHYNGFSWWRHQMETFSALLALCAGNSSVTGELPTQGQWRGALKFSLICAWIHGWVNNREAGNLVKCRKAHYNGSYHKFFMTRVNGLLLQPTSPQTSGYEIVLPLLQWWHKYDVNMSHYHLLGQWTYVVAEQCSDCGKLIYWWLTNWFFCWIYCRKQTIWAFSIISQHWDYTGSRNPPSQNTGAHISIYDIYFIFNTMAADNLTTQGAMASVAMV